MIKLFKRPARGKYIINIPVAITRKDVIGFDWDDVREDLQDNVLAVLNDSLDNVERAVYSKK